MEGAGEVYRYTVAGFFFAVEVALEFYIDVVWTEDSDEVIDCFVSFFRAALLEGRG